ncbi:MAG TPA: 4'-phosphopantetheinyl transferase superfamily protein [Gemmata sp.]|nr:4'-phosphopantetheinyl transferase superfamily protein [Gemmata sp.]
MRNAGGETTDGERPAPVRVVVGSCAGDALPGVEEVRVEVVPLDAPPLPYAELFALLPSEEQARALRYKVESARRQFVVGRGVLRRSLGQCLGVRAIEVAFTLNANGKPRLADDRVGLHFNVTHTDGLALIAVAWRPVGIDVERVRAVANPEGLVGRFFSPAERDAYLALGPEHRPAGFFRGWTCKEAVIKAAGLSVACLGDFDVELHPEHPAALLAARHTVLAASAWSLTAWEAAPGFAAALSVEGVGRLSLDL